MNRKKRHHFIPRLYLDGFCDQQGKVWTYHKNSLDIEPHCQQPKNTAFIKKFYTIYHDDGSFDTNTFEDALADIIEGPATSALKALRSCQMPSIDDRQRLSLLLGYMLVRTPSYRDYYEQQHNKELNTTLKSIATNKERFQKWADDYKNINNEPLANDIEDLRQEILSGVYKPKILPNISLIMISKLGTLIAYALSDIKWVIVTSPKNTCYLTSDNPIFISNPKVSGYYSASLYMPDTQVFIPISKNIGLLMTRDGKTYIDGQIIDGNQKYVEKLNRVFY